MKRIIFIFLVLIFSLSFVSCSALTESGNPGESPRPPEGVQEPLPEPEDGGEEQPADQADSGSVYVNTVYDVAVRYPEGWSVAAAEESSEDLETLSKIVFFDGRDPQTTAYMTFNLLDAEPPESLIDYLKDAYPTRDFTSYNTITLEGYQYDDPNVGGNGGDLREYFFLGGDVMVKVDAEIQVDGHAELIELLSGISFNQ